jgi:hypothetical protein
MREVISLNGMLYPATRRLPPFALRVILIHGSWPSWLPNCKLLLGGKLLAAVAYS